ncbi:MAG: hypothetical protein WA063_02840 [Minisyncoccia bacterium]
MKYKHQKQYRHNHYDYSQNGFYFVTICAKNHQMFFGDIARSGDEYNSAYEMKLSEIGKIAKQCWLEIPNHFPFVNLDEYIIMPNHVHGIIEIYKNDDYREAGTQNLAFLQTQHKNKFGPQSKNLSSVIRGFKIGVTKYANNNNINFIWQLRFHDRIIRNEKELNAIRKYIIDNPAKWHLDEYNPGNIIR